jgi:hypothetical protein
METISELLAICANFEDYAALAWRTASPNFILYPGRASATEALAEIRVSHASSINFIDALHTALGLSGELRELREAVASGDVVNVLEEIGDAYWYLALMYRHLRQCLAIRETLLTNPIPVMGLLTQNHTDGAALFEALESEAHAYQDAVKGVVFYAKAPEWASQVVRFRRLLDGLDRLSRAFGSDPARTRAANLQKLRLRYPESYTDLGAQRRDQAAELNQLRLDLSAFNSPNSLDNPNEKS